MNVVSALCWIQVVADARSMKGSRTLSHPGIAEDQIPFNRIGMMFCSQGLPSRSRGPNDPNCRMLIHNAAPQVEKLVALGHSRPQAFNSRSVFAMPKLHVSVCRSSLNGYDRMCHPARNLSLIKSMLRDCQCGATNSGPKPRSGRYSSPRQDGKQVSYLEWQCDQPQSRLLRPRLSALGKLIVLPSASPNAVKPMCNKGCADFRPSHHRPIEAMCGRALATLSAAWRSSALCADLDVPIPSLT